MRAGKNHLKMRQIGTILIVEDNHNDYFLMELACQRAGIDVPLVRAADGVEARAYLSGQGEFADRVCYPLPGLVVSDLKMPRMNGLELLAWVRHQPGLKRLPFVFLSASGHRSDINRAYDLYASCYLVKPARLDDLTEMLKALKAFWLDMNCYPDLPKDGKHR